MNVEQAGVAVEPTAGEDEHTELVHTGTVAVGEFRCSECGYGVIVHRELPSCPMCGGTSWEQVPWSPIARAARAARLH
jgi:rubredoxin